MSNKKLVEQILRLCEKQYRKGFNQGAYAIEGDFIKIQDVYEYRNKGSIQDYKKSVSPFTKQKINLLEKLLQECAMKDMDELTILLSE